MDGGVNELLLPGLYCMKRGEEGGDVGRRIAIALYARQSFLLSWLRARDGFCAHAAGVLADW